MVKRAQLEWRACIIYSMLLRIYFLAIWDFYGFLASPSLTFCMHSNKVRKFIAASARGRIIFTFNVTTLWIFIAGYMLIHRAIICSISAALQMSNPHIAHGVHKKKFNGILICVSTRMRSYIIFFLLSCHNRVGAFRKHDGTIACLRCLKFHQNNYCATEILLFLGKMDTE